MFYSRGIRLHDNNTITNRITKNNAVMDYAIQHTERCNLKVEDLVDINFARKKKQLCLPFELVRDQGRSQTDTYDKINGSSQIRWDFLLTIKESSAKKQQR